MSSFTDDIRCKLLYNDPTKLNVLFELPFIGLVLFCGTSSCVSKKKDVVTILAIFNPVSPPNIKTELEGVGFLFV